jgi:hypothetical protein
MTHLQNLVVRDRKDLRSPFTVTIRNCVVSSTPVVVLVLLKLEYDSTTNHFKFRGQALYFCVAMIHALYLYWISWGIYILYFNASRFVSDRAGRWGRSIAELVILQPHGAYHFSRASCIIREIRSPPNTNTPVSLRSTQLHIKGVMARWRAATKVIGNTFRNQTNSRE